MKKVYELIIQNNEIPDVSVLQEKFETVVWHSVFRTGKEHNFYLVLTEVPEPNKWTSGKVYPKTERAVVARTNKNRPILAQFKYDGIENFHWYYDQTENIIDNEYEFVARWMELSE